MIRNYVKTAWRNLTKNKFYSIINITGLAVGLAIGMLILLWVQDEFSFNRFHHNTKNIYKLENMVGAGASRKLWQVTASAIGPLAKKNIPGVKDMVRFSQNDLYGLYKSGDKTFTEPKNIFTDASFFSVFDFPIVAGDARNPFPDAHSVVLTESTAKKYFGGQNPIGKIITADDTMPFKVSAVVKDFPKNSDIAANMMFSMQLLAQKLYAGNDGHNLDNDFNQYAFQCYLLLNPGVSLQSLPTQLRKLHLAVAPDDTDIGYVLLPLQKMHLYHSDGTEGGMATVRMFIVIALLILVIACINYVNLSTARSMLRSKEVSLRKIVGAARWQLFVQFIVETALLFALATIIALALLYVLMPSFNRVAGKALAVHFNDPHLWQVIGYTITGTLLLSSIYPALLLSSFEPMKALKGKIAPAISDALFRKVLVVTQFAFSVILITGTLIVGKQLSYMRSKQLGYDKDQVLTFNMLHISPHAGAVKAALLHQPGVARVTLANMNLINYQNQTGNNSWEGKQSNEGVMVYPMYVDKDFIPFFKLQLVAGNGFTGAVTDSTHFLLNETAVQAMHLSNPVGKKFRLRKTEGTIIGVVKDFYFTSLRQKIQPVVFSCQPGQYRQLYIKTTGKDVSKVIAAAATEWQKYNAGFPFDYSFLDEDYNNLYKSEQQTGTLFSIFAIIAILISCLGLFGLAAYTAQVRTREIGIRKVLGAGAAGIVHLLASDFIKLVLISIVIAVPASWYAMNKWLQDFAYKVSIGWGVFAVAGCIALLIAFFTISFQSVKAAIANPVKSLRTE